MKIEFEFELEEKVTTILGERGIVKMQAVDDGGVKYSVQTKDGHMWHNPSELTKRWYTDDQLAKAISNACSGL